MLRAIACFLWAVTLTGCGSKAPLTAHGKPVTYWLDKIADDDVETRLRAVRALGNVGANHPHAIPALTHAVKDHDLEVRTAAILALLRIGPPAKSAISALYEAQRDSQPEIRDAATKALARIQP